ncbi:MAG: AAA family ATPase [Candidatus Omnitrophica bacterium]|nr:AAA family ATPase [Candidatus Omnitrophota bacterium]
MVVSNTNYEQLESFSRRNLSAQMGQSLIMFIFVTLIQVPLSFGFYYWLMSGGMAGASKNKLTPAKVNVKWHEVIGMEGAKKEAWEIVKLLKDRHLLRSIGGKIVKGTMMMGPPGCGKTYLAKAIATECGLPFIPATGSDFVGMFIGVGTARMKSLFKQARALAAMEGGCIIFIDEIDSFARPRQADKGFGGAMDHNATVNQFLTEMDGLRQKENNIVVIAATNVSEEDLDPAIMRAGRFDRKIHVTYPNLKERKQMFDFYLSGFLGFSTDEFPGASEKDKKKSIEKLCNAVLSASQPAEALSFDTAHDALDWLNETIVPFQLIPQNAEKDQLSDELQKSSSAVKTRYGKELFEFTVEELHKLKYEMAGKRLKRLIIEARFSHKSRVSAEVKVKFDEGIDTSMLAARTVRFSPADIENMVREAGLIAARNKNEKIALKDLSEAYDRISFGLKSNLVITDEEKKWTSYHEAGHAIIGYLLRTDEDVIKATIIPRKGSLGYVYSRPSEEKYTSDKDQLMADIKVSLGAYAAERIKFGTTSSGVGGSRGSDFGQAMSVAHHMVWSLGMGKSGLLGDFHTMNTAYGQPFISEKTKETLDADMQDILQTCLKEVAAILTEKKDLLEYFAQELLKKGELEYDEIEAIFDKFGLKRPPRFHVV